MGFSGVRTSDPTDPPRSLGTARPDSSVTPSFRRHQLAGALDSNKNGCYHRESRRVWMQFRLLAEALLSGKPYFGSALRAMQGPPERHQYFLPVVSSLRRTVSQVVEILEI